MEVEITLVGEELLFLAQKLANFSKGLGRPNLPTFVSKASFQWQGSLSSALL
jgi:hypothetical protein